MTRGSMTQRVLITGIQGFTGAYLATEFEAHDWEVWGLGQYPQSDTPRYGCANLSDIAALCRTITTARPDVIIHLAAAAFVGHGDPSEFYMTNVIGTRNLLEAIEASAVNVQRVILASSANIYGNSVGGQLIEDTRPNPANDYAVSKCAMEQMAYLWRDRLPLTVTRPFNYTGIGQAGHFLVPKIVKHFLANSPVIELGNLDVWRDFSDVRDIAVMYRKLAETSADVWTVNFCSGETHSLRSVIGRASEITGHSIDVQIDPNLVRADEVTTLSGSTEKLHGMIGELPRIPLEDTLRWMLSHAR